MPTSYLRQSALSQAANANRLREMTRPKLLTPDLIPYIEAKYKLAADQRTLEGHSFGGMFADSWTDSLRILCP
jgi:predicted alpha/beta superfamily hydrolase